MYRFFLLDAPVADIERIAVETDHVERIITVTASGSSTVAAVVNPMSLFNVTPSKPPPCARAGGEPLPEHCLRAASFSSELTRRFGAGKTSLGE